MEGVRGDPTGIGATSKSIQKCAGGVKKIVARAKIVAEGVLRGKPTRACASAVSLSVAAANKQVKCLF